VTVRPGDLELQGEFSAAGAPPSTLLQLAGAPQARLGARTTDPSLHLTVNLSLLDNDRCTNFNQPALWFQNGRLYLVVQCFENPASGDGKAAVHFVFSTTPSGADATKWQWQGGARWRQSFKPQSSDSRGLGQPTLGIDRSSWS
jgi:hypothetical protein